LLWISMSILAWIASGVGSTIVNKKFMVQFPYPMTLTLMHLISGTCFDSIILHRSRAGLAFSSELMLAAVPTGILLFLTKVATYFSYEQVPASLVHTLKVNIIPLSRACADVSCFSHLLLSLELLPLTLCTERNKIGSRVYHLRLSVLALLFLL
jgi:hypothetical protein